VRRRVEQLIAAWDHSAGFLESPALASAASPSAGMPPGTRLGPWRLVSVIGSGGMGTVYRAERADDQFTQEVAVKVVAAARVNRAMERCFREERQILARLEHANVARLIDGGVAPDGSPYLVMELVAGMPIDAWCREDGLDTRARLRLFRRVCEAVQFAHQHLVVHCDLKPGNILVTEDGTPKLLDFGIARLMAQEPAATATLLHPMTLEYASPEQARGTPLGTATDIYSLGVLLHELLTGRRPFQLSGKPLDEVLDIVCRQEPAKPATGSADLDAIVLMALRKEPAQRYASAGDLAADITRFLEGRPVQAHPPRAGYVLRKFVSRHRLAVAAAVGATALAFAAGIAILRESRIAGRRFEDVRQLARFVTLEYGKDNGQILFHLRRAEELDDQRVRANPSSREAKLDLSFDYSQDANFQVSRKKDLPSALALFEKTLAIREKLAASDPKDIRLRDRILFAELWIAKILVQLKRPVEASAHAESAFRIANELYSHEPSPHYRAQLAWAYHASGNSAAALGRHRSACDAWAEARRLHEENQRAGLNDASVTDGLAGLARDLATCK
jgi:tetratricopeptide (TPR) repeat protein